MLSLIFHNYPDMKLVKSNWTLDSHITLKLIWGLKNVSNEEHKSLSPMASNDAGQDLLRTLYLITTVLQDLTYNQTTCVDLSLLH